MEDLKITIYTKSLITIVYDDYIEKIFWTNPPPPKKKIIHEMFSIWPQHLAV